MSKLGIPRASGKSIGGPKTFMTNLLGYLDSRGISYSSMSEDVEVLFFPIEYTIGDIVELKSRGGKVIQRLDGIYYPSKHGHQYTALNKTIQKIYSDYADQVIFQSDYSRRQCFEMFGEKRFDEFEIVCNGVNLDIFHPSPIKKRKSDCFKLITTGNFRNADMLEPVIDALDILRSTIEFRLAIVGPITNSSLSDYINRDYVDYYGSKTMSEISDLLRASDVFIYSHLNPPCPNSVLEAISTGLPVVGYDSGSMKELCFFNSDLLAYVSNDVFQRYKDFDPILLAEKISICLSDLPHYSAIAQANSSLYSFDNCGAEYVRIFKRYAVDNEGLIAKIIRRIGL